MVPLAKYGSLLYTSKAQQVPQLTNSKRSAKNYGTYHQPPIATTVLQLVYR